MIENTTLECDAHTVDADSLSSGILTITGELSCGEIGAVPYELRLTQADVGQLQMRLHVSHSSIGRTGLAFASSGDERSSALASNTALSISKAHASRSW